MDNFQNLFTYMNQVKSFRNIGFLIGQLLAVLHSPKNVDKLTEAKYDISKRIPDFFNICYPDIEIIKHTSNANIKLLKILQENKFHNFLESAAKEWSFQCIIHNDIKFENFLVPVSKSKTQKSRIKLIDWELFGLGDPSWDIGCVFSSYLTFWIYSLPLVKNISIDSIIHLSKNYLDEIKISLNAFWKSYFKFSSLTKNQTNQLLLKSIKYSAVRIIQRVYESLFNKIELTSHSIFLLQLSLNIFNKPSSALSNLLGLHLLKNS